MRKIQKVLGYPIIANNIKEITELILTKKLKGWVVTLNLEMIALSYKNKNYRELLNSCDNFTADGMPIYIIGKFLGKRLGSRGNGTDLTFEILTTSKNQKIAVIGGIAPNIAIDKLNVLGNNDFFIETGLVNNDYFESSSFKSLLNFNPDIIFVALGVPKQDELAVKFLNKFPTSTVIGVGGAFDLLSGIKPRSPRWVQNMSLEWLHRLITEPRRLWKRYLLRYPFAIVYMIKYLFTRKSLYRNG